MQTQSSNTDFAQDDSVYVRVDLGQFNTHSDAVALFNDVVAAVNAVLKQRAALDNWEYCAYIVDKNNAPLY